MNIVFLEINKNSNSLHKELYNFLKIYKKIDQSNFNKIYEEISKIINDNFIKLGSQYKNDMEFLSSINLFYKSKYSNKYSYDYPYYLLTLFFKSTQITYNQNDYTEKLPLLKDLDNAIELLMVMLPRDIIKDITLSILHQKTNLYLLINSKSTNFEKIKNFEKHYSSYTLESYKNGYSFISRPFYKRPENSAVIIGNYGQSDKIDELYIVILNLDNYCVSIADGLNKIISIANFVFINLFKYLPQEELTNFNVQRIEFYVLISSLFAFLNHKRINDFVKLQEFIDEFSVFVKENTQIISFKIEKDKSIVPEIKIDDRFKDEMNKYLYLQGTPKTQISGLNTEQLNKLFKKENSIDINPNKAKENIQEVNSTCYPITNETIINFLNIVLVSENENFKSKNIWNNLSEIGYIYQNKIYFLDINEFSIVNKFKLTIENITNTIISTSSNSGTLMKRFGHMFERYVEELLRKRNINVLISQNNDPDVIAEYNGSYYFIECKAWLKDVELVLGYDYMIQFKRLIKKLDKAKKQAQGWAKKKPEDINISEKATINPVVLVPYPVFSGMYLKQEKELNTDIVNVCTPEDLIKLIKNKKNS